MAFICTLDENTSYNLLREADAAVVVARVGYDPEEAENWFVHVGLDVGVGGDLEYYFRLLRVNVETGIEDDFNSGRDTARIIEGNDRGKVLTAALAATSILILQVRPKRFYRVTRDSNQPPEALEKHHAITNLFYRCGYRVHHSDEFFGQRTWYMERDTNETVDAEGKACFDPPEEGDPCDGP